MERSRDWWTQSQADLRHAGHSLDASDYDWACFASHQAAEKAVKALFQRHNTEARVHTISLMLARLPQDLTAPPEEIEAARTLDKLYIPARYPNGIEQGAPTEFYTRREAMEAINFARAVMGFCADYLH